MKGGGGETILLDLGPCGVEVTERADSDTKKSIKEGRESQPLLPVADLKAQWKNKDKEELHSCCQNTERKEEKAALKGTTGIAPLHGSMR
jgi:hypothetical protein